MPPRLYSVWVTSLDDGVDHAVTDEEMAAGMAHTGEYTTLCDARMFAAPLTCEPLPKCPRCAVFVRLGTAVPSLEAAPRHRRTGPMGRFWLSLSSYVRGSHVGLDGQQS